MKKILISLLFAVLCSNIVNAADLAGEKDQTKNIDKKPPETKIVTPQLSAEQKQLLANERKKRADRRAEHKKNNQSVTKD